MSEPKQFEVLILGSGEGGKKVAWHMARSGRRTAVVERRWIGGSCPNIACLPSKNEISSARVAHLARHAAQFGTMISGPVTTDMARFRQRKRNMVEGEIALYIHLYQTIGGELIIGTGRFVAPKTLEVRLNDGGTRVVAGDQVFLDIGTHAAIPSVPSLEAARPLTHIEALGLDYLPSHLVVLGGGYVGLEMAQAYRRFGSRVTIIETGPQLMTREDPDVAGEMQRILSDEGIQILVAAETLNVKGRSGQEVSLTVHTPSGEQKIEGSDILAAAGRVPNTAGIGLEEAGVELDAHGYIRVNERLETTAPTSGLSANAPAARSSRTHPRTTFVSSGTISSAAPQHARSAGSVLHVHGPAPSSRRIKRGRSEAPGCGRACCEAANEGGAPDGDDGRNARLYEGSSRCER